MGEHFGYVRKVDEGGIVEAGTATVRIEADTKPFQESMGVLWDELEPIEVKSVPSWFTIGHRLAELGLLLFIAIKV